MADRYDDEVWYRSEAASRLKEKEKERHEFMKNCLSPYKQIARDALMNWNGLTEEEATKIVRESTNEELEAQVHAESSINHALEGIKLFTIEHFRKVFGYSPLGPLVSDEDIAKLKEAIMNGPLDANVFWCVKTDLGLKWDNNKIESVEEPDPQATDEEWDKFYKDKCKAENRTSHEFIIYILSKIHDGWVKDNQKKFMARDKKYQHMPIELIGYKEAKSDLLFLKPILDAMGIKFWDIVLEDIYNERVEKFLEEKGITDVDKLTEQISKGAEFYPALEGQDDIIQALQDPEFVKTQVVSGIRDKGIGTNELFAKKLFGQQVIEGADELETLREQKQDLVKQEETISKAEELIEAKENQGQSLDD